MVTGASGYIAGWIVKDLLEAGHTVHATVRNPDKAKSVDHRGGCSAVIGRGSTDLVRLKTVRLQTVHPAS
jgi:uncharacterized protein YbjT (DUF2867 family)